MEGRSFGVFGLLGLGFNASVDFRLKVWELLNSGTPPGWTFAGMGLRGHVEPVA